MWKPIVVLLVHFWAVATHARARVCVCTHPCTPKTVSEQRKNLFQNSCFSVFPLAPKNRSRTECFSQQFAFLEQFVSKTVLEQFAFLNVLLV